MSKTIIITTRTTIWGVSSSATFTDTFTLSNLGPLTTTFTPPPECLNTWYVTTNGLKLGVKSRPDCFPPGFSRGNYYMTSGYYSPGLCPSSYTGAMSLDLWWTAGGVSGLHCCPIGYVLPAALTGSCFTTISPTTANIATEANTVNNVLFSEIWAPAIPVMWKSLAEFTEAPAKTTPPTTNRPTSSDIPAPGSSVTHSQPTESGIPTEPNGGPIHSHTRTIAIATAVPIIVIILIILGLLFLRRRTRLNAAAITDTTDYLPELEGNVDAANKPRAAAWPAPIELPAISAPIELPTSPERPVELPVVHPPAASAPPPVVPSKIPVTASVDSPTSGYPPVETLEVPGSNVSSLAVPARKLVPVAAQQDDPEMEWLNRELERVNERRENLRKLEALNDEHRELERRIHDRKGGRSAGI